MQQQCLWNDIPTEKKKQLLRVTDSGIMSYGINHQALTFTDEVFIGDT